MWTLRALKVAAILTPILPRQVGVFVCRTIGIVLFAIHLRGRRQVLDNLRHVMPTGSHLARWRAALRVFNTVVLNYYDLLRLRTVDRDRLLDLIDLYGTEHLKRALEAGKGVIILSAHIGNFGVVGQFPAALGIPSAVIAEQIEPRELFTYMARLRSSLGVSVIPPGRESIAPILRLLRKNGVLLVAGDRDVNHHGLPVEFFGAPASLPPGPVLLAARTGAALIPAYTIRTAVDRSAVFIAPPLELVRGHDLDADLQQNLVRVACCLESMIRTDPGQWAVLQSIWGEPPHFLHRRAEGLGSIPRDVHLPTAQRLPEGSERRAEHVSQASDQSTA